MDLFDFSLESPQITDMTPGIAPNQLFWTAALPPGSFRFRNDGTRATLNVRSFPLVDQLFFGNLENALSAEVDVDLEWRATGDAQARGLGADVAEDNPGRFEGMLADAVCSGRVSGRRIGWSFRTKQVDSSGYYASLGREKNGSYL
ncbi:MAG: hypothetical protein AAF531_26380 [Actinomycetota bacterium]